MAIAGASAMYGAGAGDERPKRSCRARMVRVGMCILESHARI